jgi:CheY-like chemotaxis protein
MASILVIDDDEGLRDSLGMMLRHAGHAVALAADGQSGLALAAASAFDLVITDLRMPGMDGAAAVRALRALPRPPRIMVMTGGAVSSAPPAGADAGLAKPFRPRELYAAIDRVLRPEGG